MFQYEQYGNNVLYVLHRALQYWDAMYDTCHNPPKANNLIPASLISSAGGWTTNGLLRKSIYPSQHCRSN